jgi:flagellin FlaB
LNTLGATKLHTKSKKKKGLAGLDTAIILIAFIITASVLAYVAVSMGIFVTQKAKTTINKGQETASTALSLAGNILYATNYPTDTESFWLYLPIAPSAGVSSVQLAPATTSISLTASTENIVLSNIYNYTLLTITNSPYLQSLTAGSQTYYYYSSPYTALLALGYTTTSYNAVANKDVFQVQSGACSSTTPGLSGANYFTFNVSKTQYCAEVYRTFAFTFPVAGDSLVGSSIAPAGSVVGVMILFGPAEGHIVFQYQTITIQVQPNIGSPLTVAQYVYQPDGTVTVLG